jgi:hypothetical protein
MRSSSVRYVVPLLALLLAVLPAPARASLGQETEPDATLEATIVTYDMTDDLNAQFAEPVAAPDPAQLRFRVNLPFVGTVPTASPLQFATQVNPTTAEPINPGAVFGSTRVLYVTTLVTGARGLPLRFEWTVPRVGNQTSIVQNFTVSSAAVRYAPSVVLEPPGPLPKGTYTVKLFLNNVLVQESSATIR